MPNLPVGEVARSFTTLVEGLAIDCERIANERENTLRTANQLLMEENLDLRKQLVEARSPSPCLPCSDTNAFSTSKVLVEDDTNKLVPLVNEAMTLDKCNETAKDDLMRKELSGHKAIFTVFDSGNFSTMSGDMRLPDKFWLSNQVRDVTKSLEIEDHVEHAHHHHGRHLGEFFLLDPSSKKKLSWDILGIPILAWDLITIPMQVFDIADSAAMLFMGWVTLLYWTIDIPITFITGIFDSEGSLVMKSRIIFYHYLRGFFALDSIIIGADWMGVVIEAVGSDAPGFLKNLGVLRVLRISRFVRLMRLRKLKAKWQAIEDSIDNEWLLVSINLFGKCCIILGMNHYIGCIFYMIGKLDVTGGGYTSWLLATPYPQYGGKGSLDDAPWGYKYLISLHWAVTQFTPGSMHVQPQNIPERLFTIWCLVFGLVVFSSFLASVTQARMQLSKMMSKFERDLWLLRKYCRQNKISLNLTIRMKRYVDLVLIPKFNHMTAKDVALLPQLSQDLQQELQTELVTRDLRIHPFFELVEQQSKCVWNKSVILSICNTAVATIEVARCDVIFCCGEVSKFMLIVLSGVFNYLPLDESKSVVGVEGGHWISEACLWTSWTRQGQLMASREASAMNVYVDKFRDVIKHNGLVQAFAKNYATAFMRGLNAVHAQDGCMPSDLQEDICLGIDIKRIGKDSHAFIAGTPSSSTCNTQIRQEIKD